MGYIDEITANDLTGEAKHLGRQIGDLIIKVREKFDAKRQAVRFVEISTRNP